jgi:two-component system, OmpR family, response regulator CpxR
MTRILLIEDDVELCNLMVEFFTAHDMQVECEHDGYRGLGRALMSTSDIVLLDVMLPGLNGFEVLTKIRQQSKVPVIMLTARTSQKDRILGLESGADDYLPKPFGPEELLARVRAVLRRTQSSAGEAIEVAGVWLHPGSRAARVDGQELHLTSAEFDILKIFLETAGKPVSRDVLARALYQRESSPFERTLDVHVSNLRKKLLHKRDLIRTVRSIGYLFSAVDIPGLTQETMHASH